MPRRNEEAPRGVSCLLRRQVTAGRNPGNRMSPEGDPPEACKPRANAAAGQRGNRPAVTAPPWRRRATEGAGSWYSVPVDQAGSLDVRTEAAPSPGWAVE